MRSQAAMIFSVVLTFCFATWAQAPHMGQATPMGQNNHSLFHDGVLTGTVSTSDNQPVANARVEIRGIAVATEATVTSTYTNSQGVFEFSNLPEGLYDISVYSGLAEAHEQVQVRGRHAMVSLRMPANATDADAGNGNTVSVSQFKVPGKARDAFKKAQQAAEALKLDEAEKYVAKALDICPNYAEAIALRGILKLDRNNAQAATADLEQAVKFDPGYPVAYIALGAAYNMLSRFDDALRTIDRAIALSPTSWQCYFEMGKAYVGKADYSTALKQLNKAENMAPKEFVLIHLVKADAMLGLKDYADAMSELEAYLQRESSGPDSQRARQTLEKVRAFAADHGK